MQQTLLATVVLPAALFLIMLGMGLALKVADFRRVVEFPKAVVIGLLCQMLLLPAIGFGVVKLVGLGTPELAVGLMVLTFCPGGTTSNMLTYLARGDVALSITLTAVVSLVTPFTIPVLTSAAMSALAVGGASFEMPLPKTIVILLAITVIPVAIGMALRHKWEGFAAKAERPVRIMSVVFLFAIIGGLISQNREQLTTWFADVGVAALLLNAASITLGYGIARLAKLSPAQQTTIGMEVGIQNGTTALLVTGTLIGNPAMTIAPAIYSLIMFATGGLFGYLVNARRKPEDDPAVA